MLFTSSCDFDVIIVLSLLMSWYHIRRIVLSCAALLDVRCTDLARGVWTSRRSGETRRARKGTVRRSTLCPGFLVWCGGVYFVCDHGKHGNAKRYDFGCKLLPGEGETQVTLKIVPFSKRKLTTYSHYTNKVETPMILRHLACRQGGAGPGVCAGHRNIYEIRLDILCKAKYSVILIMIPYFNSKLLNTNHNNINTNNNNKY